MSRHFYPCLLALSILLLPGCTGDEDVPEDEALSGDSANIPSAEAAPPSEPWGVVAAAGHGAGAEPTLQILDISPAGVVTLQATGLDPSDCEPNAGNRTDFNCSECAQNEAEAVGPKGHYIEVVTTNGVVHPQPVENSPDHYTATIPTLQNAWVYGYVRRGCGEIIRSTMVSHSVGSAPDTAFLRFGATAKALPTFCCSYPPNDAIPLDFAYWNLPQQGSMRLIIERRDPIARDTLPLPLTGTDYHGIYHLTNLGVGKYDVILQMVNAAGEVVASEATPLRVGVM